jgi:4-aminobutyrate aminotransferase-like enzyme
MAAVVTTPEIAASFANGMEFFSTFGGNPVSCAIGLAVLEVIEAEGLQARAEELGADFLAGLRRLGERHELVGDARGAGLFLGLELVRDRETLEPAAEEAALLVERMRQRGVLLSTDGPLHNVIKIKPPMVLTREDVDRALWGLDDELARVAR